MNAESVLPVKIFDKMPDFCFGQEHTLCSSPSCKYWHLLKIVKNHIKVLIKEYFCTICAIIINAFTFN